jgi:tetratricopeptide (TPR) repeat protein
LPIATTLNLAVAEYKDAQHWYWRLTDEDGKWLADQEVKLNPADAEYEGFLDLPSHLARHSAPDRRREDEARLVRQVGEWMGRHFYGSIGDKILDAGTPAIVRVQVPEEAAGLLYRPWELGYVQGQPLALQDVTLIFEVPGKTAAVKRVPVGERLRILAVFSLPVDANALNLRQERYELARTIRAIGQQGRAIDLRVLQYGVTRDSLKQVLEEGEGWDVVHFSGHGLEAHLILEKLDGTVDRVPSNDLVKLLRPARGRLKWVTLSACLSAAATVEETLAWLGVEPKRGPAPTAATGELQTVARALVQSLDCAVLAMRYPVGDQFAIDLGRGLFEGVLEKKQSLARALQVTLPKVSDGPDVNAAAVATPTLFGRYAAELALPVPKGEAPVRLELAHFPDEPKRFVGRVGLLTKARGTMARECASTGVLFYGMSGGGKTACALELAYQYQDIDRFQHFVWFEAPKGDSDISGALIGFARQWDIQVDVPEVPLIAIANADDEKFAANLPRLSRFLEQRSVLMVLDNLESLLRENGQWRDPRWEKLMAVLVNHHGQSRVVLTSRIRPQPHDSGVLELPVHSLTLQEAALLARQSPNLGKLLREPSHRALVIRALKLVQGHPELLRLAEAQATSPEGLAGHLERAEEAGTAGDARLEPFFRTGESALDASEFLSALFGWTRSVAGTLSEAARGLFYRLCWLEEEDREEPIIKMIWDDAASHADEVMAAGLVDAAYRIHPGVAEAGREEAGQKLRDAVDVEMAKFWIAVYRQAREKESEGMGGMVLRAGRSAVPYLMRQKRWDEAQTLLDRVIQRDKSPATLAEALPLLRRIVELTDGTEIGLRSVGVFARALAAAGRTDEAAARMQIVEEQAVDLAQFRVATAVAGDLVNLLRAEGHFEKALATAERVKDHTRKAGLGRWTQLGDESSRLQILNQLGRCQEVLTTVQTRREEMKSWPESSAEDEAVDPWNVMEGLLDTGRSAALRLRRWEEALSLNAEIVKVMVKRGATKLKVVQARYNDYAPLLRLQRYGEARSLLYHCLAVHESDGGSAQMGRVHGAIADLEDDLQRFPEAVRHQSAALRYSYSDLSPSDSATGHFNLAHYLMRRNPHGRESLAHRLASVLIRYQMNHGELPAALREVRKDLAQISPSDVPASFDEVCVLVEQTEGVRFRELYSRLPKRAASGDEALQAVLAMARTAE